MGNGKAKMGGKAVTLPEVWSLGREEEQWRGEDARAVPAMAARQGHGGRDQR